MRQIRDLRPKARLGLLVLLAALALPVAALDSASLERAVRSGRQLSPQLGVHVVDLESGRTVYDYRADDLHIVASNTKLVTTAAALDRLGPGYLFETRFLMRGAVREGALEGDLAVIGGGDPNISGRHFGGDSYAVFRSWAAALRERGVRRVSGDIFLDHGLFVGPEVHPDWPDRGRDKWYQAPVSALSFSDNCVLVKVTPSRRVGAPAKVDLVPDLDLFDVENRARTSAKRSRHQARVRRRAGGDELTVQGTLAPGAGRLDTWISVADPVEYFGSALRDALAEEGIAVAGELHPVAHLPGLLWEGLAVYRSDLLTSVHVTNKRSQNFYAESILKTLGAVGCGRGSWSAGIRVAREFLAEMGVSGDYSMADGSGMSRRNRFTPRQLTTLLRSMYFHRWGREFLRSLPFSGEEELSWNERLADEPYRGNVFAKTGTLSGVSTLSGYVKARSGKIYAFSVLCNGVRGSVDGRRIQDRIVRALVDAG
ncbi:MAG: D-alanyl-D-alanine carboxypeptidase/D-alanyl-D-alanine-endopeptidase [Acidobacteriota bacterium]